MVVVPVDVEGETQRGGGEREREVGAPPGLTLACQEEGGKLRIETEKVW